MADSIKALFAPSNSSELIVAYFAWVSVYVIINIAWDYNTKRTPDFHWHDIGDKGSAILGGSTLCSSVFVLSSLLSPKTAALVDTTLVPIIFAGGAGVLQSLVALCPYRKKDIISDAASTPSTDG